ncbi:uncharacterized protein LOC115763105 [Drosophila novamexicana]|nr:uncharacterized protein LOC115763105 [Drosophila novamexicana]XP_030561406.1 uncharacterized protein LOC115763105 [Drosophila novamexicana]XP_030561407.1 uncharacterized protein LOC115763105 [Drosophila novamexicana]
MTTWGNICRICSSPADYNIFAKIPTYLHGSTNEFLNYQKPINVLLEETSGLKNSPDDGLPSFICALCISYLKHAVTFREQCIKNALSLKLIELYQQKSVKNKGDKESALFTAEQLSYVEQRPVHNLLLNNNSAKLERTDKVHKQLLNQTVPQQCGNNERRIRYLNDLFDKHRNATQATVELPSTSAGSGSGNGEEEDYAAVTSSDDNEENALSRKHKNCYNYSETNFEEDDPMEQAQLRDIKVNIPEPMWKERKCPACSKRYMHEDSHQLHLDNCVEFQFISFVSEVNKLLEIKRQKMVSPHEFIRRMIFALHKTCTWLQEHSIDTDLADKLNQSKITNGSSEKTEKSEPAQEAAPKCSTGWDSFPSPSNDDALFSNSLLKFKSGTNTPITAENNVLYAIERSESRNSQNTPNLVVKKPIPIRCKGPASVAAATAPLHEERARATFLEKLQRATVTPQQQSPVPATPTSATLMPFSAARCSQCNLVFESVSELEIHNVMHHNGQCNVGNAKDEDAQRRRIIALFEDDI